MPTFSYGQTPPEIIRVAVSTQCKDGRYHMELPVNSADLGVVMRAVNQGIDSYLEAVTGMVEGPMHGCKRCFSFSPQDMVVLCRRLGEIGEGGDENAESLRACILKTLQIEEI